MSPNPPLTKSLGYMVTKDGFFEVSIIPDLPASKITSETFDLARIPVMSDAKIPNLETLSYGGAFADAQIPSLGASKITSEVFDLARIPVIPHSKTDFADQALNQASTPKFDGMTLTNPMIFDEAGDQIKFSPSSPPQYWSDHWWMCKPHEGILFGIYKPGDYAWKFQVGGDGEIKLCPNATFSDLAGHDGYYVKVDADGKLKIEAS